jgi:hypothetical protein
VGDLSEDKESTVIPDEQTRSEKPDTSSDYAFMSEPLTHSLPVVEKDKGELKSAFVFEKMLGTIESVREHDSREDNCESRVFNVTADTTESLASQERDNNVNEVCPWEDE